MRAAGMTPRGLSCDVQPTSNVDKLDGASPAATVLELEDPLVVVRSLPHSLPLHLYYERLYVNRMHFLLVRKSA